MAGHESPRFKCNSYDLILLSHLNRKMLGDLLDLGYNRPVARRVHHHSPEERTYFVVVTWTRILPSSNSLRRWQLAGKHLNPVLCQNSALLK